MLVKPDWKRRKVRPENRWRVSADKDLRKLNTVTGKQSHKNVMIKENYKTGQVTKMVAMLIMIIIIIIACAVVRVIQYYVNMIYYKSS
jgi:hypothetical protein